MLYLCVYGRKSNRTRWDLLLSKDSQNCIAYKVYLIKIFKLLNSYFKLSYLVGAILHLLTKQNFH